MASTPQEFKISFSPPAVERMNTLMRLSQLPEHEPIPDTDWDLGVNLVWLKALKKAWEEQWKWEDVERYLNQWEHWKVDVEGIGVHYVHAKSNNKEAIPIILLHGWPGTFYDFHKVIELLRNPGDPTLPSFHVVIPSLPGYGFSDYPPRLGFTLEDTARIFNTLMTDILGYKTYVGQGGDWGSFILRIIGTRFSESAPLIHLNMFRTPPPPETDPAPQTFSEIEQRQMTRTQEFLVSGKGYADIQGTKPATIGYAVAASPLSLLAYIGEKFHEWSDPTLLDVNDILATVAIYYLTGTFPSSVLLYHQSKEIRREMMEEGKRWNIQSKVGYSAFPYETGGAPKSYIRVSAPNLVMYKERHRGGHFPALDNPTELVEDIRELVRDHWSK